MLTILLRLSPKLLFRQISMKYTSAGVVTFQGQLSFTFVTVKFPAENKSNTSQKDVMFNKKYNYLYCLFHIFSKLQR